MADQRSVEKLPSNFTIKFVPIKDLLKVSTHLFLLFQVSCASTWVQPSKLTNLLELRTIVELQPIVLRILIRAVSKCNCRAALKMTKEKCHFAARQVESLGRTISSERISPQIRNSRNFTTKLRITESKQPLQRYFRFMN